MNNLIKNPVPFADGNRVSKLVKVRNTDKQDNTSNAKERQRLVLKVVVIENAKERYFTISNSAEECLGTPPNFGSAV